MPKWLIALLTALGVCVLGGGAFLAVADNTGKAAHERWEKEVRQAVTAALGSGESTPLLAKLRPGAEHERNATVLAKNIGIYRKRYGNLLGLGPLTTSLQHPEDKRLASLAFEVFSFPGTFEKGTATVDVWVSPGEGYQWYLDGFKVQ